MRNLYGTLAREGTGAGRGSLFGGDHSLRASVENPSSARAYIPAGGERTRAIVDVGTYDRSGGARSYARMTSDGSGVLNYVLEEHGGKGQPYGTPGGGGSTSGGGIGGGGGSDVFV